MDITNFQNFAFLAERSLKQNLAARHPELLGVDKETDVQNAQAVDRIFLGKVKAGEWEANDQSYEAAFALAQQNGELKLAYPMEFQNASTA